MNHLIIFAIIMLIFALKFTFNRVYKCKINWDKLENIKYHPFILFWRFLFHLWKNNFDILPFISLTVAKKKTGFFYMNMLFKKIIIVYHPEYVKELLNDPENIDRPLATFGLKNVAKDCLFLRNGQKWKDRKQQLMPIFHTTALDLYIPKIEECSKNLVQKLNNKKNDEWIQIFPLIERCFYDVALDAVWEFPEKSSIRNYALISITLKNALEIFTEKIFNIFLWSDAIFYLTSTGVKFKKYRLMVKRILRKAINNTIKNGFSDKTKYQMLPGILFRCLNDKKVDFTVDSLIDELITIAVAAYHTSAITMNWILYEIGKNPDIQYKIQNELYTIFQNDNIRPMTKDDLNKMQYLECVIKESLRMYSSGPFITRSSKIKHIFGNEIFPENSIFIISFFHLHRSADYFTNPENFQPERFLPENSTERNPFSFLPFSFGERKCPGNRFAVLQMKICLATIIRKFFIQSLPEKCVPIVKGLILSIEPPVRIKISPRIEEEKLV